VTLFDGPTPNGRRLAAKAKANLRTPTPTPARTTPPRVFDVDVETVDGRHISILATFAEWQGPVACYDATIPPTLTAIARNATISGLHPNTEIRLTIDGE
jgi:hypothetical protein